MELNLSELTLTSFNSFELNLTEFTAMYNFIAMGTMENNPNPQFNSFHLTILIHNNFKND
jgi:hypothetical protein